ncbi:MAG: AMP-binding protein [Christensenellaceae bacterium]|nr:AMP-binding protein [Christensenellaceae bacterium]
METKQLNTPEAEAPWLNYYGDVKFHLNYPDYSIADAVFKTAEREAEYPALSFMGKSFSYKTLVEKIDAAAAGFVALGVKKGDKVTICMPNVPQAVFCLYALNRIGAIASMIHPLSAVNEIVFYLKEVGSKYLLTLDQFYGKLAEVEEQYKLNKLIITSAADELGFVKCTAFKLMNAKKNKVDNKDQNVILWKDFINNGKNIELSKHIVHLPANDPAVILFSGGTTGVTKGISLSGLNFNALGLQTAEMCYHPIKHARMLAAMPIFHGFGLGVCIHTILEAGGTSILVPQFNVKKYAELIKTEKPNYIAGVPTLFEALTRNPYLDGAKLDYLKGVFSGGDSLSIELKKRFDAFLVEHGATVRIREGYGTTECVTASCLTPYMEEREGSIGIPFPDTYYKICNVGSNDEVPYGELGEICLRGPSVMLGYLNHPEENANTLRVHADGHTWLHTGDLGYMDKDGFIYFKQRIKRMIITSGYNVYPSQLENIIDAHEAVQMSCVIGIKDEYKMQKVKAYVVLKDGFKPSEELRQDILAYCRKHIAKYAMPYTIEFRSELPKTLVGKVAYTVLEKEANTELESNAG